MLISQLYKPNLKIKKINFLYRFISKLIIFILGLDKFKEFSNSFQQTLSTSIKIVFKKKKFIFKDGHERLLWRYKTQFKEEKFLCNWIDNFAKNDIFCDIGSNVGMFTVYAAKKNLTYSIEPHPANLHYLYWNLFLNSVEKNVIVIPNALYDHNKKINFILRDLTPGVAKNFLGKNETGLKNKISFRSLSTKLDDIILNYKLLPPNKIKIDVDGNELHILKGLKKNIKFVDEIFIEIIENKKEKNMNYFKGKYQPQNIKSYLKLNSFVEINNFGDNKIYKNKKFKRLIN